MTLYRCDVMVPTSVPYVHRTRCPREAIFVGERDAGFGQELFYFCEYHAPSDWEMFDAFYRIKDRELVETALSKIIRENRETKYDAQFMRGMRIRW